MEIRQLRYFIAVADTLNFSRAAESVYLSQSSLSRQIMELEKEVGTPLFRRSTRQVVLTDAGRALQKSAKELISCWEKMIPELRKLTSDSIRSATLTLGVDDRALERPERRKQVMELLYRLRRDHPGLRILIRNCAYQELISGVSEQTIDCALVLDREVDKQQGLLQQTYGTEEMVLVFRSDNPHQDGDYADVIMNRGLILVDKEPQGLYHIIHILSDLKLEPQIRFCESFDDMTMTVETGESAMILPETVVDKLDNASLQVLHLPTSFAKLYLMLLWSKEQFNPMVEELRLRMDKFLGTEETL